MTKILVIEDEEDIREELVAWLHFEGYEVHFAENGRQGVQIALAEKPDLIISDIRMPGMDGREVLLHIRADPDLSDVPFVFVTASAERDSVRLGMNLGADDYITKPFTADEILNTVQTQIRKHHQSVQTWEQRVQQLAGALDSEREARLLKSRLVAMFSHDFRNPLAVIKTSADLVLNYDERLSSSKRQHKLKQITSSVALLTQMLDDMLLMAEIENGQFEPKPLEIDIIAFIQNIIQEFRETHAASHTITLQTGSKCIMLSIDPKLLRQIIVNLLSNALKYSPSGREVIIQISEQEQDVVVSIQDFGIGIPPAYLPHLFEPFHRAENAKVFSGTGLGLTIVKQAVDYCEATIDVDSVEGKGTTFTLLLPIT